jgi:O-antigen/teichoic acid export membrane protein
MAAYHLVPTLKFNPFMAEWKMFRKMFNFGTKLQVAKLANLLAFQLNAWLISAFLHVGMVTPYGFAAGFIGSVRNLLLMLPSAVIPATSELESRNEKERSLEFYDRGTRYLVLFGTPICTFSIVTASLVMLAWLGPEYKLLTESVWVVQILAIGYYANLSTGVATGVAVGMGKPEYEMKFGVMLAISSLVLSVGLVYFIGFYGPAVGSTISLTVCALYFYKLFHRYLKQPMIPFLTRMYGMPILISTLAGLVISVLQWQLVSTFAPVSRLPILAVIVLEGLVFSAVYIFLILRTSYMDAYDLNLFRRYLEKFGLR